MGKTTKATKKFATKHLSNVLRAKKERKAEDALRDRIRNKQKKRERARPESEVEDVDLGQTVKRPKLSENEDELDVDSFLEKGFFDAMGADSDDERDDNDLKENEEAHKDKSLKMDEEDEVDEMEQHRRDLEELKKDSSQAEFLEYLQKEAPELLEIEDDDDILPEEDEEDEDKPKQLIVTLPLLEMWEKSLFENNSIAAFKRLIQSFRVACNLNKSTEPGDNPEESSLDNRFAYRIEDPEVFNHIVIFIMKNFTTVMTLFLEDNTATKKKTNNTNGQTNKASTNTDQDHAIIRQYFKSPKWSKLKPIARTFFINLNVFIEQLSDPKLQTFVLQHSESTIKFMAQFPSLQKKFLKHLLVLWSSASEAVRVLAFFNIRRMALDLPYPFIDHCLKGLYLTYVRNCKQVNKHTLPLVNFLCNCVVELYGIDFVSSYQHAFVYIRELASHLRKSFSSNKKVIRKNIYNFQYLNSINAWVRILLAYPKQEHLSLLYYPLTQLIQGTISYQPSNRYFPLRLHCVRMLNQLAESSGTFINASAYLLEILESPDMIKKPKPSMEKSLEIETSVKASKNLIGTRIFQESIFDETIELLAHYTAIYSRSIAFPELVFPITKALNKYRKSTKNTTHAKRSKILLEKINATVALVQAKRNKCEFSPKDLKNVERFMHDEDTPLTVYVEELLAAAKKAYAKKAEELKANENESIPAFDESSSYESDSEEISETTGPAGSDDDMIQEIDDDLLESDSEENENAMDASSD